MEYFFSPVVYQTLTKNKLKGYRWFNSDIILIFSAHCGHQREFGKGKEKSHEGKKIHIRDYA
jgi:hypothetical protein